MHHPNQESAISGPINLLKHYSFESNGQTYEKVLNSWLERFPLSWVNLALVESLHQGRYKVVSVEQILTLWQRRGKPSYHFNHDFERLVSNNLPQSFEGGQPPKQNRSNNRFQRRGQYLHRPFHSPQDSPAHNTRPSDLPTENLSPSEPPQPEPPSAPGSFWTHLGLEPSVLQPSGSAKQTELQDYDPHQPPSTQTTVTANIEETEILSQDSSAVADSDPPALDTVSRKTELENSDFKMSVPFSPPTGDRLNPIHQFVPQSATSVFYSKLTAMAQINV